MSGRYKFYLQPFENSNTGMFRRENWPEDEPETRAIWTNASDSVVSTVDKKIYYSNSATIWRWRREVQNDFAARIAWTTKPYRACNHPPVPRLAHSDLPVTAPVVDSAVTIHFILKVTDKGAPPLTRYKRVIVTVVPK